jgi:PTH2 family peptidyl-tRNA hydrolase
MYKYITDLRIPKDLRSFGVPIANNSFKLPPGTLRPDNKMTNGESSQTAVVLSTAIISMLSGFLLGVYSIRGYLISPALAEERRKNINDPVESDESDIDDDESILDHAPNWASGAEADRRDGLRSRAEKKKDKAAEILEDPKQGAASGNVSALESNEECKLVLVVRTDLGMTKGLVPRSSS